MTIKIDYAYIEGARYGYARVDDGPFKPYLIEPLHKQIWRAIRAVCRYFITFD